MRKNKIIEAVEKEQMKAELPDFAPGDTVSVQVRVAEGGRELVLRISVRRQPERLHVIG